MKIGFFDSGLGGLVVMNAVRTLLPQYDYVFFGDTANVPYGDKTEEEIYELTRDGVEQLFEEDCALVIIACNTASAETLRRLQDTWLVSAYPDRKLLGVIVPMAEEVVECHAMRAVLIATNRTVSSGKYKRVFETLKNAPSLFSIPTPQLVPLIEKVELDEAFYIVEEIVTEALTAGADSLILGCTHYALLLPLLHERYGNELMIFSPDQVIPKKVFKYLERHSEIEETLTRGGSVELRLSKYRPEYELFIHSVEQM
jgi:glutamate racemase